MAHIDVRNDRIAVQLTRGEKLAALHGDLSLPRTSVLGVEMLDDGLTGVRGVRAPGLRVPRRVAIGTWRHRDGKDFVVARRGQPAVRLSLAGQPWSAVLIGVPDPSAVAARLRGEELR